MSSPTKPNIQHIKLEDGSTYIGQINEKKEKIGFGQVIEKGGRRLQGMFTNGKLNGMVKVLEKNKEAYYEKYIDGEPQVKDDELQLYQKMEAEFKKECQETGVKYFDIKSEVKVVERVGDEEISVKDESVVGAEDVNNEKVKPIVMPAMQAIESSERTEEVHRMFRRAVNKALILPRFIPAEGAEREEDMFDPSKPKIAKIPVIQPGIEAERTEEVHRMFRRAVNKALILPRFIPAEGAEREEDMIESGKVKPKIAKIPVIQPGIEAERTEEVHRIFRRAVSKALILPRLIPAEGAEREEDMIQSGKSRPKVAKIPVIHPGIEAERTEEVHRIFRRAVNKARIFPRLIPAQMAEREEDQSEQAHPSNKKGYDSEFSSPETGYIKIEPEIKEESPTKVIKEFDPYKGIKEMGREAVRAVVNEDEEIILREEERIVKRENKGGQNVIVVEKVVHVKKKPKHYRKRKNKYLKETQDLEPGNLYLHTTGERITKHIQPRTPSMSPKKSTGRNTLNKDKKIDLGSYVEQIEREKHIGNYYRSYLTKETAEQIFDEKYGDVGFYKEKVGIKKVSFDVYNYPLASQNEPGMFETLSVEELQGMDVKERNNYLKNLQRLVDYQNSGYPVTEKKKRKVRFFGGSGNVSYKSPYIRSGTKSPKRYTDNYLKRKRKSPRRRVRTKSRDGNHYPEYLIDNNPYGNSFINSTGSTARKRKSKKKIRTRTKSRKRTAKKSGRRKKNSSRYLGNANLNKLMRLAEEELILHDKDLRRMARRKSKEIRDKSYSKYLYHPASYFQRKSKDKKRIKKYNYEVTKGNYPLFPDPGLLSKGNRYGFENLGERDRKWVLKNRGGGGPWYPACGKNTFEIKGERSPSKSRSRSRRLGSPGKVHYY